MSIAKTNLRVFQSRQVMKKKIMTMMMVRDINSNDDEFRKICITLFYAIVSKSCATL